MQAFQAQTDASAKAEPRRPQWPEGVDAKSAEPKSAGPRRRHRPHIGPHNAPVNAPKPAFLKHNRNDGQKRRREAPIGQAHRTPDKTPKFNQQDTNSTNVPGPVITIRGQSSSDASARYASLPTQWDATAPLACSFLVRASAYCLCMSLWT
jgi:hypothetical protein